MSGHKRRVKKGDSVRVIAGRYKNKTGLVKFVSRKHNMVVVENLNKRKVANKNKNEKTDFNYIEKGIDVSNIRLEKKI